MNCAKLNKNIDGKIVPKTYGDYTTYQYQR